jgi:uncharacterized protein
MGKDVRFPDDHAAFLERCHQAGQIRPTPLLLEYAPEDYNCLHRDLYGEHVFPMQIAILLDQPGEDFVGGEFVMTEQRPRMQTRAMVLPLKKGDAAVFAVNSRPMKGVRGNYQVQLNHGVSKLYSGKRHTVHSRSTKPRTASPASLWAHERFFCAVSRAGVRLNSSPPQPSSPRFHPSAT